MPAERERDEELGALWLKDGQRGEYLSGHITIDGTRIPLVCFRPRSQGNNSPDWRILRGRQPSSDGQRRERPASRPNRPARESVPDYESW